MYLPVRSSTGFAAWSAAVLTNKKTSLLKTSLVTVRETKWRARERNVARRILLYFLTIIQSWIKDARPRNNARKTTSENNDVTRTQPDFAEIPVLFVPRSDILIISRLTRYYKTARWISHSNFRGRARAHTHAQCSALRCSISPKRKITNGTGWEGRRGNCRVMRGGFGKYGESAIFRARCFQKICFFF